MKKKVCFITATRAEYGLLRWVMEEIRKKNSLELQLVVTGTHLEEAFGNTLQHILDDGFHINAKVPMQIHADSGLAVAQTLAHCCSGMANVFNLLLPDCIVVLGDRYELLAIVGVAVLMKIPVIHIAGGDVTEGAIDDQIRHAVTKMSSIHFPGYYQAYQRILQMGESPERVFLFGDPALDNFLRLPILSRNELAKALNLPMEKRWVLMTVHPETQASSLHNIAMVRALFDAFLIEEDYHIIVTYPNSDPGNQEILAEEKEYAEKYKKSITLIQSLGQQRYLSLLKNSCCMAGNSSSGIFESQIIKLPVILVGDRQKGRIITSNILHISTPDSLEIRKAINDIETEDFRKKIENIEQPYGDGNAAERIAQKIEQLLFERTRAWLLKKTFNKILCNE